MLSKYRFSNVTNSVKKILLFSTKVYEFNFYTEAQEKVHQTMMNVKKKVKRIKM